MSNKDLEIMEPWIFGEVVLDCFGDGAKVLGGAPFNVAWHLKNFGLDPLLISSVGSDDMAETVLNAMYSLGMRMEGLQINKELPTGHVNVTFEQGEPDYDIVENVAFDHIDPTKTPEPQMPIFLYNGSLALRNEVSQSALLGLLQKDGVTRFIDVNLRQPYWNAKNVNEQLRFADYVKVNESELNELAKEAFNGEGQGSDYGEDKEFARRFKNELEIVNLIVTQGENGAYIIDAEGSCIEASAPPRNDHYVDSVGAGDAFSAVIMMSIIDGWDLHTALDRAQAFASFIVTQQGATCSDPSIYHDFISFWGSGNRTT